MGTDKIAGKAQELKGKAKQAFGDATDNGSMEAEGVVDEGVGKARQAADEAVENVQDRRLSAERDR